MRTPNSAQGSWHQHLRRYEGGCLPVSNSQQAVHSGREQSFLSILQ